MKNKKTTEFYTIADEDIFDMMFGGLSKKKIEPTLCGKIKFNNGNIEDIYWHEDGSLTISNFTNSHRTKLG